MTLQAIKYQPGTLEILDQLLLPHETKYIPVKDTQDGWTVIRNMQVRGAPAIGVVGCLSMAAELHQKTFGTLRELTNHVISRLEYLVTARPTAVNMADSCVKLSNLINKLAKEDGITVKTVKDSVIKACEVMLEDDVATNKQMGNLGAEDVLEKCGNKSLTVLTHCNTGSLATAGYGTALGVVRSLNSQGKLDHCYCTETRPYNQGARLTAYELVYDELPATLICDSMASVLMKQKGVNAVFVGADRVVANGDTANKIGTYQIAIAAKHHGVLFYVVAPSTSIDLTLPEGSQIVIEERPHRELTHIKGIPIAADGIGVWNPAFDVTPAELITGGIVTEFGVFKPSELKERLQAALAASNQ